MTPKMSKSVNYSTKTTPLPQTVCFGRMSGMDSGNIRISGALDDFGGCRPLCVRDGRLVDFLSDGALIDFSGSPFKVLALPAPADVHVHLREPGFEYKETIATGTAAAAAGGFTDVCAMPNLRPVPDSTESLRPQLDAIGSSARIRVHPYGAITKGEAGRELADIAGLAPYVVAFSDDGKGLQDEGVAREAFAAVRETGKPLAAHCEVESLVPSGGCVHMGAFSDARSLVGIPSASEWRMVERDLGIVRDTGVRYHVCHVSTKESVELIRAAKRDGLPVTCETAPHYLILRDGDLADEGRFKMNPPVRGADDRDALLEGIADGTIDCIATDHAPHSPSEKGRGLAGSAFGIVGLETSLPLCATFLVKRGIFSWPQLVDRMSTRPRAIFGLPPAGLSAGSGANAVFVAVGVDDKVDPGKFLSKGRATPFAGWPLAARVVLTLIDGRPAYDNLASIGVRSPFPKP